MKPISMLEDEIIYHEVEPMVDALRKIVVENHHAWFIVAECKEDAEILLRDAQLGKLVRKGGKWVLIGGAAAAVSYGIKRLIDKHKKK